MLFFFFFQAEDGIRDGRVTGVQTCALPISAKIHLLVVAVVLGRVIAADVPVAEAQHVADRVQLLIDDRIRHGEEIGERLIVNRSEERRVGKECRSRWAGYREKKKKRK